VSACHCTGHTGKTKTAYRTRRRAVTIALRRGWRPVTYRCPTGAGWHLTHGER
jgi:hypothetical protein